MKAKKQMLAAKVKNARKTCPECGGTVHFAIGGPRNHLHMACETAGCIMSMWPRNKPLSQPPHFRTGSVPPAPQNPVERAALVALNHARNDRSQPKSRKVAP